jgi:hypothetical protein
LIADQLSGATGQTDSTKFRLTGTVWGTLLGVTVSQLKACVYCGATAHLTRDHIPPKSLFNPPRPDNLITVPACDTCNKGFSADDDYFWLTLASRAEAGSNPDALPASLRAIDHLSRPEATGFRSAFLKTLQAAELVTPSGLLLRRGFAYDVSFERLNRVAARITRGLYCFQRNALMAPDYVATARALDGFPANAMGEIHPFLAFVSGEPRHSVGRVFSYQFASVIDDSNLALLLFTVYDATSFLGLVLKRSDTVGTQYV